MQALPMVCRFDTGTLRSFQEYKLQQAAKKAAQARSASVKFYILYSTVTPTVPAASHSDHYSPQSFVDGLKCMK